MRVLRLWLLALLLLVAQAGALGHGVSHLPDPFHDDEPACDLCLAYAPVGAGFVSTPPVWSPPAQYLSCETVTPTSPATGFRPSYRSRAPPRA